MKNLCRVHANLSRRQQVTKRNIGKLLPFNPSDLIENLKSDSTFFFFFFFANTASIIDDQRWYFFQAIRQKKKKKKSSLVFTKIR